MSFFEELKRRNVFRVGIAYAVAAWIILQATDVIGEILDLPQWGGKLILIMLGVGFILALFFAWAYELTPEGVKRESEVDRSRSITPQTGRKLDFAIIALLAVGLVYFIYEARFKEDEPIAGPGQTAQTTSRTEETSPEAGAGTEDPAQAVIDADALAVLPFAHRSAREEDRFFTDGIHDDLLTQLAKIGDLKVISRTSVMEYRETTKKIPEIATELGVGKILEGGVQRAGDRVRINAQLIDVATDQHLWAETFDREMTIDNIFDIQSEITRQIVTAVKGELSADDERSLGGRPTDSLVAWEAWLHAEDIVAETDYTAEKYQRAEPFALKAVEEDPKFAEAWATLAGIQMQGIWIGYANTEEQRERVRASLAHAVELAPESPTVKAAQADYHYRVDVDYERCLALLREASAAAPGKAEIHRDIGLALRRLGRWEEAIDAFERTLELDPLNSFAAATMAETLVIMNAWERLIPFTEHWVARDPKSGDLLSDKITAVIYHTGDLERAAEILASAARTDGPRLTWAHAQLASFRRDWDRLLEIVRTSAGTTAGPLRVFDRTEDLQLGFVYLNMGDEETARGHFERYLRYAEANPVAGRIAQAFRQINLAAAEAALGNAAAALRHAELATELLPREDDHLFGSNIENQKTWVLAWIGQRDLALERIAAHLDRPEGFSRWQLHLAPAWDFFRDDPRFNDLVRPEGVEPEPFRTRQDGT